MRQTSGPAKEPAEQGERRDIEIRPLARPLVDDPVHVVSHLLDDTALVIFLLERYLQAR